MAQTMKEAVVGFQDDKPLQVELRDVPVPKPGPGQLLIKVVVSGTNPKDWKIPMLIESLNPSNSGDDIAGIVHAVGENVSEFKPGDRVAAFHKMTTPHGSFAEYAIGEANTAFHIPSSTSFEEAATIPLAAMTAVIAIYSRLGLPAPWDKKSVVRSDAENGVIVYGGASAVGAFTIKLLQKADVHPLYVVAGKGTEFVKGLISPDKGDRIFDYRNGNEALVRELKEAVGTRRPKHAVDAVSEHGSYTNIVEVLEPTGKMTTVLPGKQYEGIPETVDMRTTQVGDSHDSERELGAAWFRLFGMGLAEGWFTPHPHEVVPGGLAGLGQALRDLQQGKASAVKYVVRVSETAGI